MGIPISEVHFFTTVRWGGASKVKRPQLEAVGRKAKTSTYCYCSSVHMKKFFSF